MTNNNKLKPDNLTFTDQGFAIWQAVQDGPARMMVRELTQNGIEATWAPGEKVREIRWYQTDIDGTPKLSIHNTGIGMSAKELFEAGAMACNSNKQHGLDKNFGQGAKIASLKYNSLGVRYRSCKNGKVSQMILAQTLGERKNGETYDTYGRLTFDTENVIYSNSILNVTENYKSEDLSYDWTEVVLMGNSSDQDTTIDPYGDGKLSNSWLAEELYHRFYRIPKNIRIILEVGHKYVNVKNVAPKEFETLEERKTRKVTLRDGSGEKIDGVFEREETIVAATKTSKVKIHFIQDTPYNNSGYRNSSKHGGLQSDITTAGIIFKNETYALVKGGDWYKKAPALGLPHISKQLHVHIELPDDFPILVDSGRTLLKTKETKESKAYDVKLSLDSFESVVSRNLPQWVKDLVDEARDNKQKTSRDSLEQEMRDLMKRLVLRTEVYVPNNQDGLFEFLEDEEGNDAVRIKNHKRQDDDDEKKKREKKETKSKKKRGQKHHKVVPGSHGADKAFKMPPIPNLDIIYNDEKLEGMGITNMAGQYVRSTNTLFVNGKYRILTTMFEEIHPFYISSYDDEYLTGELRAQCESKMIRRLMMTIIKGIAHEHNKEWTTEQANAGLTESALTVSADNYEDDIPHIKSYIGSLANKKGTSTGII